MTSHGIARTSQGPRSEDTVKKELQQIEAYRALEDQIKSAAKDQDLSEHTLDLTTKLLKGTSQHPGNPEYYTVWNQRRRVLLSLFADDPGCIAARLRADLDFQLPLLKKYPKCYWIWYHRIWLLAQASTLLSQSEAEGFWQAEFSLVNMMFIRDHRNFHGWNYRRRVVRELQRFVPGGDNKPARKLSGGQSENEDDHADPEQTNMDLRRLYEGELVYTKKMVGGNLSNFSAWHQRSKLIPRVLDLRNASEQERRAMFDDELEYIREAALLDPPDQSLWFYHQYIMSVLLSRNSEESWVHFTNHDRERYLANEIHEIRDVIEDTDDCKWIYQSLLFLAEAYLEVDAGDQGSCFTTQDLTQWLGHLRKLDPLRKGRWNDLSRRLGLG